MKNCTDSLIKVTAELEIVSHLLYCKTKASPFALELLSGCLNSVGLYVEA